LEDWRDGGWGAIRCGDRSRFVEGGGGLVVRLVSAGEVPRLYPLLDEHHFLGHCLPGRVVRYVATVSGGWVAPVGFGSAALSVGVREELIGWDATRYRRLRYVSNNQRFVCPEKQVMTM